MLGVHDTDARLADPIVPSLRERVTQRPCGAPGRPRDVDDDIIGTNRLGGDQRTVDDEVRTLLDEQLILAGERFALGGVHHEHRWTPFLGEPAHSAPLAVRREPCATATAQAAALNNVEHPVAADRSPAESRSVRSQRLGAAVDSRSGEQARAAGPRDGQR